MELGRCDELGLELGSFECAVLLEGLSECFNVGACDMVGLLDGAKLGPKL